MDILRKVEISILAVYQQELELPEFTEELIVRTKREYSVTGGFGAVAAGHQA
ncbi:hypothetical protein ACN9MU_06635 [Pseudoduganella sp. R-32]|uniref:hypothetical protein n=1 Tax=Pseudoduganella sp. R-32 TaxID=3404061 RepID=UPI003CED2157